MLRATQNDQRQLDALWLPATALSLLIGAGLLVLTSTPESVARPSGPISDSRSPRPAPPERLPDKHPEPIVVVEDDDEPFREPWWLMALTFLLVIGVGLLFLFYAQLPPFLR